MTLHDFFYALANWPTSVFFFPFGLFLLIMLIDLVFNVVDSVTADMELFDLDNIPGSGLLLPPVLSKVPLMVALCTSFFVATVLSFYMSHHTQEWLTGYSLDIANVLSIPVIAYLALIIAAWMLKPLSPLFDKAKAFASVEFVGMTARVHSSKVTALMGEVMVMQNGNEYLLDAVIEKEQDLAYGDEVVIVSREKELNRYVVMKNNTNL
ncbi:DUF1449 domain-containing protein [Vibrio ostreicida]|uniref:DUF1449 domain-containing protein n=1 Tax=Vibrio ostreicida TaxID=526588 RepID=A0ABT8BMH9_9VIBR|nr:DUF1449 domain-containing protein [Vibrio ostreicida]MDN3608250.1 DUF1449 domain-containing protein [Vibrio ostreicida]NPD09766.1 DUF1449 domain-containing protein [Vibrio ostreicida]